MKPLALPTAQLADRLLGDVPCDQRLDAATMVAPRGVIETKLASLQEVHLLLEPHARTLPAIHLESLATWVQTALGDVDLGRELHAATRDVCYVDGCKAAHALISQRLDQARRCRSARAQDEDEIQRSDEPGV